jgi:hypothetical protein
MSEPTPDPASGQTPAPHNLSAQKSDPPRPPIAWQPFTPRGIAAFAGATFGRLFIVQVVVALLAAGAAVWFLSAVWFPAAEEAIRNVSGDGAVRAGHLDITGQTTERLVTNRFLTFAIDTQSEKGHAYSADVFVVLRSGYYEVCSLFGCRTSRYPVQSTAFNRLELEARCGAWKPFLLGIAALGVIFGLLFSWGLLATIYFLFVRTFAFFADRNVTFGGSWRLCGAALLAGAVLLIAAIVGYGFGVVDVVRLLLIAVLHVVVPWVLIVFATRALPRVSAKAPKNPFASTATPDQQKPAG